MNKANRQEVRQSDNLFSRMFHRQNFSADIDCVGNWCLHYEVMEELKLSVWVKFIRHFNLYPANVEYMVSCQ
jgi:hypothetical protein